MKMAAIQYFDDLTLPKERWFLLNQLMLKKIGIGNNIQAIKQHFENLIGLIQAQKYDTLKVEFQNTFQACNAIINAENWDYEMLAVFIKSANGKEIVINDMSDLEKAVTLINKLGQGEVENKYAEIKKKLTTFWKSIFLKLTKRKYSKLKVTM